MSFVKYQNTNNASSLLIADITASQTTILITDGDQSLFPSKFPFLLTLEHLDANENVILREIVKAVSGNQNSFTVERSAGICVQDDTATNRIQDNTAHAFYSGDKISLYWTAEQVADIQNNIEGKANQESIASVYDNALTYQIGDKVAYEGNLYICQTAITTPEEFDSTKWTKINIQYQLKVQQTKIDNIEEQISTLGGIMKVDVLVLGGGGGGGKGCGDYEYGGGGGAGEVKELFGIPLTRKSISVAVASGGTGGTTGRGGNGGTSRFGVLTAMGGGGGGGGCKSGQCTGADGASGGGGGGSLCSGIIQMGGKGIVQGNGFWGNRCVNGGGGGGAHRTRGDGGARQAVVCWNKCNCVNTSYQFSGSYGGQGIYTCFGGTLRCLAGGGNGGLATIGDCWNYPYTQAVQYLVGPQFGGGLPCCNGKANSGGGGGGGYNTGNGGAGGSGLVIVRYPKDCSYGIACATGGTITTPTINGIQYVVHTFTSSGTFCITQTA